jgi:uncharacterized repeat protein (TIGR03803 family)
MIKKCFITSALILALLQFIQAQFTSLIQFETETNGGSSYATLVTDGTWLYGTTGNGLDVPGYGTVFRVMPDGSDFQTIYEFSGTPDGRTPICGLYYDGTWLYGTTLEDGFYSAGTVFKLKPDGSDYVILHHFNTLTDGQWPKGSVISDGTYLYGTTNRGLSGINGLVYRVKTDGTDYETIHIFDGGATGASPQGALISDGTWLYGLTERGGTKDDGVVFRVSFDGSNFEKIFDFNATASGEWQFGSLLLQDDWLLGMNQSGGENGQGTLFKLQTDGNNFTTLLDFELLETGRAGTSAPITDGTYIYAMTQYGGTYDDGVIFRIKPDGTEFLKMFEFQQNETGSNPTASLLLMDDFVYGVTNGGGENSNGLLFKYQYQLSSGIVESDDSHIHIYPNPSRDQFFLQFSDGILGNFNRISIIDNTGKMVWQSAQVMQNMQVNVSHLAEGVYTVSFQKGNTTTHQTFVKIN